MQKAAASSAGDLEEAEVPSQSRHLASAGAGAGVAVAAAVGEEGVGKNVGAVAGVGDDAAVVDHEATVVREGVVDAVAAANLRRT